MGGSSFFCSWILLFSILSVSQDKKLKVLNPIMIKDLCFFMQKGVIFFYYSALSVCFPVTSHWSSVTEMWTWIFNMRNGLCTCFEHEGEAGTDVSSQVLIRKNWKNSPSPWTQLGVKPSIAAFTRSPGQRANHWAMVPLKLFSCDRQKNVSFWCKVHYRAGF